jgi:hypothetical protein
VQRVDAALDALESGDVDAYQSAIRRIEGPAAVFAETALLERLDEPPPGNRGRRMLAAWGLSVVGGRAALASLDIAAEDPEPRVAALAERSAAVIRARLARGESGAGLR